MRRTERDERLKLMILQGTLYRRELIEARIALCEASKPFAMGMQLLDFMAITLKHRRMVLIGALVPQLLGLGRSSRFVRRVLLILGSSFIVWWLMRRRSEA